MLATSDRDAGHREDALPDRPANEALMTRVIRPRRGQTTRLSRWDAVAAIVIGAIAKSPTTLTLDAHIVDALLPDLVGHDKRPAAFVLYLWLWAMTQGSARKSAFFSYQVLSDRTGLSKRSVQRAVAWLERRQLLRVQRASPTAVPEYSVLTPWKRV
jgi:hypothetical protein